MRSWTAERGLLRWEDGVGGCGSGEVGEGGDKAGREGGEVTNSSIYPGSNSLERKKIKII